MLHCHIIIVTINRAAIHDRNNFLNDGGVGVGALPLCMNMDVHWEDHIYQQYPLI